MTILIKFQLLSVLIYINQRQTLRLVQYNNNNLIHCVIFI